MRERLWSIVLAGGEGRRLGELARDDAGLPAPKQFCRLGGERSLLAATLLRARRLVPGDRIAVSLLESHRRWWAPGLADHPGCAAIVQPCGRGTATGVLAALLHVWRRDPRARVVIMPSDHAVEDEQVLTAALEDAIAVSSRRPDDVILLGFAPESPDPTLGWILPSPDHDGLSHGVAAFVEKPDPARAAELMGEGGLWNAMLIVAPAEPLLGLYRRILPELAPGVADLNRPHHRPRGARTPSVRFEMLPGRDLSRDLLTPAVDHLRVVRVPPCGWTDLGTPARLLRWQESRWTPLALHGTGPCRLG